MGFPLVVFGDFSRSEYSKTRVLSLLIRHIGILVQGSPCSVSMSEVKFETNSKSQYGGKNYEILRRVSKRNPSRVIPFHCLTIDWTCRCRSPMKNTFMEITVLRDRLRHGAFGDSFNKQVFMRQAQIGRWQDGRILAVEYCIFILEYNTLKCTGDAWRDYCWDLDSE